MDATAIGWTIATAVGSVLLAAFGLLMRTVAGWACLAASFLPIVVMAIISLPELLDMESRVALSLVVGAVAGALLVTGVVELRHTAQAARPDASPGLPQPSPSVPPLPPHDNTFRGQVPPGLAEGSDNTVDNDGDSAGNVMHKETEAFGSHACAPPGSTAFGSHAMAGACAQPTAPKQ